MMVGIGWKGHGREAFVVEEEEEEGEDGLLEENFFHVLIHIFCWVL